MQYNMGFSHKNLTFSANRSNHRDDVTQKVNIVHLEAIMYVRPLRSHFR